MEDLVRIAVCVDDTDDVTKTTSTGAVAEAIAEAIVGLGGLLELDITRHQLLLAECVPYTSHNSSMAMAARVPAGSVEEAHRTFRDIVKSMMADGSDPGLCIARVPDAEDDPLLFELVAFGCRAKEDYISKAEAHALADRIGWLTLEELGGDGQGMVGALAGVGLRLSGSDGRFRGKWDLGAACEGAGRVVGNRSGRRVADAALQSGGGAGHGHGNGDGSGGGRGRGAGGGNGSGSGRGHGGNGSGGHGHGGDGSGGSCRHGAGDGTGGGHGHGRGKGGGNGGGSGRMQVPTAGGGILPASAACLLAYPVWRVREALEAQLAGRVLVVDAGGSRLPDATPVCADEEVKPLLYAGCFTIVADLDDRGIAHPCRKADLDALRSGFADMDRSCPFFEFDNDLEEFGCTESVAACPNCLYRRWTASGFICMKRTVPARSFSEVVA